MNSLNLVMQDPQKNYLSRASKIDLSAQGILRKKMRQSFLAHDGAWISLSKSDAKFLEQCFFYKSYGDDEPHVAIPIEATVHQIELIEKVFASLQKTLSI